jgi:hypothetical protein
MLQTAAYVLYVVARLLCGGGTSSPNIPAAHI